MKKFFGTAALLVYLFASAFSLSAAPCPQQQETTPKQDIKDAGASTKNAAKKTGSATKKESKKVVNKSAQKTDEGAKKVEDKTQPKN